MMLAADGAVACASTANVFAVRAGTVTTPQLSRFGVAGVMRRVALREAAALNIAASEATLSWHDLVEADELFLTNARIGVVPVSRLVDATREWRAFAPGQVALRLAARIEALDA
jgi:4-amino-4-deoxychorismate lyase